MAKIYYIGDWAVMLGPMFAETPFNYAWKGEDRWLVMLGNWCKDRTAVTLRFSGKDRPKMSATDEETGESVDIAQPIEVKGHNYRIIQVRW